MVMSIDEEMKQLNVISRKTNEENVVRFALPQKVKRNPIVLRIESITMLEYVPVINGSAKIPDKFDVCSNINVTKKQTK